MNTHNLKQTLLTRRNELKEKLAGGPVLTYKYEYRARIDEIDRMLKQLNK